MLPESDQVRLRHMLDAAREALQYAQGKSREDLDQDTMLFRALVKCIEIIGEAATRVTTQTKEQVPVIPWAQILGMRNRLIHAYFDVNKNTVWGAIEEDLPALERDLAVILEADQNGR